LHRLLQDWEDRRRGRELPSRKDFDPGDIRYIVGNLSLVDVTRDPLDFRFRIHATNVADRMGFDMTGKMLATLPDRQYAALIRTHYTEVVTLRRPVARLRNRVMTDQHTWNCEVLVLPLSSDGQTVDMLMSAFVWL
jgi:hypothetical protein